MLADSHAHLDDLKYEGIVEEIIDNAKKNEVGLIVNPGCDEPTSLKAIALSQKYDMVYANVGFHPEFSQTYDQTIHEKMIREWTKNKKVVGIGEIGLDYYYEDNPDRAIQKKVFEAQMGLAGELGLPVVIHDREAHQDTLEMIRACMNRETGGSLHCYSGSVEMARQLLDMGLYIGIDGPITFKNARKIPDVVAYVPLDHLLIETDSPYLTPEPFRGKRNEPANVKYVAEKIAEIRGISVEAVQEATWQNCCRFYNITGV